MIFYRIQHFSSVFCSKFPKKNTRRARQMLPLGNFKHFFCIEIVTCTEASQTTRRTESNDGKGTSTLIGSLASYKYHISTHNWRWVQLTCIISILPPFAQLGRITNVTLLPFQTSLVPRLGDLHGQGNACQAVVIIPQLPPFM